MANNFRDYQQEADVAIYEELLINNKCLVKMFCGTGKSKLMRYCKVAQNKKLVVYVVPSLSLLEQFYTDYLQDFDKTQILRISCEQGSTTDATVIVKFLKKKKNKIICVTYQSFETLINLLGDIKIDVCIFDEAHHATAKTYQIQIFETDVCEKQIFFTATPKDLVYEKCGKLVYDYSYHTGVMEGYLNPFEIRIDFSTEDTNASVYESIARAVLASSNSRGLTFHADVNGDSDTAVLRFVNESAFIVAFNKVLQTEFPEKIGYYKRIKMIGLSAEISMNQRKRILSQFDETPDDEVFIISSCQTIGEGIDTKNANMCVFVDPKSSFVAITQNIGRIVRKNPGILKPNSTILIACWVDKAKYLSCDGDKDKCDEVIRQDLNKDGNFNGILNVMSALKQESEDLFDACLNYPSTYSPQEIEGNLAKHGYQLEEPIGDGLLVESLEHMLDTEIDLDDDYLETDEDLLTRTAEENNVTIEVHSNSLETPIEYYGKHDEQSDKEIVRIFRSYDEELEEDVYQPIVKKDGTKRNTHDAIEPLRRENRFNIKVHTNPDVKVLWNLSSELDLSRDICSCIIDCEVIKYDPMEVAQGIVERAKEREKNGGNLLPTHISKHKQTTDELKQEKRDANRIQSWKNALNGSTNSKCLLLIKTYLDNELPNWNIDLHNKLFLKIQNIYVRAKERAKNGGNLLPKLFRNKTDITTDIIKQEHIDASVISNIKRRINKLPKKCFDYLNEYLPDWNSLQNLDEECLAFVKDIIKRALTRKKKGGNLMPKHIEKQCRITEEFKQENKDRRKLDQLKNVLNGKIKRRRCSNIVSNYLDKFIPEWNADNDKDTQVMNQAEQIVNRAFKRKENGANLIPKYVSPENQKDINLEQEHKDYVKLACWKMYLNETGGHYCSLQTKTYLDKLLPNWYSEYSIDDKSLIFVKEIVMRAKERKKNGGNLLPKRIDNQKNRDTPDLEQEYKDSSKLSNLKNALKGSKNSRCSNEVRDYLDEHLTGWRPIDEILTSQEEALPKEEEIIIKIKPKQKKSAKLPKLKTIKKTETSDDIRVRTQPLISQYHNKFLKMHSGNLSHHFQESPQDFIDYHRVRDECLKTFEPCDIPCNRIIAELEKIKTKKGGKHVVDMGCGTATIAEHFKDDPRFQFTNYDHVAINDTVQVCDISHLPLEDDSVNICIMSLALWGSNCEEYIQEAKRVLETNGTLYIIDSTKRWSEKDENENIIEGKEGNRLKQLLETNGFQITRRHIDKWCLFVCMKQ
jgi:ribosomal RNA-processing protein 8